MSHILVKKKGPILTRGEDHSKKKGVDRNNIKPKKTPKRRQRGGPSSLHSLGASSSKGNPRRYANKSYILYFTCKRKDHMSYQCWYHCPYSFCRKCNHYMATWWKKLYFTKNPKNFKEKETCRHHSLGQHGR